MGTQVQGKKRRLGSKKSRWTQVQGRAGQGLGTQQPIGHEQVAGETYSRGLIKLRDPRSPWLEAESGVQAGSPHCSIGSEHRWWSSL